MGDICIVGIGNPYRGDDAVGWAVIDALEGKRNSSIHLSKRRGSLEELLEIFEKYPTVYLVDACLSDLSMGSWVRIDARQQPLPSEHSPASTHGLGVSQAIAFAGNLGLLPAKLIIYAIAGDRFNMSDVLSPIVMQAVEHVVQELLNEEDIYPCMNSI